VQDFSRAVTRVLRRAVPFDGVCLLTVDPATLLPTGEVVEDGLPAAAMIRLTEIELREPDFNKFTALARTDQPTASLSGATAGDLDRSLRQRELRRPSGFADELRAVLSGTTGTWGALTLLREARSPHFTPAEVRFVASLARALADGLRRAALIGDAYEELSSRCFEINVPTAVRSSAIGEDSGTASFAGIFDTYLGVSGQDRVLDAVRACWASLFNTRAVAYRLRAGTHHRDMPMAVGVIELIHARASGVAFSAHPVTGKTDRVVIETSWGWGEAVVQGLVTPDHAEVGKADGRVLKYQVADKTVVSAFDYAVGRVIETEMPARLVSRRVLDEEQIAAITDAVLAVERHYGYPVDVEWVLDRHRREGEPVCVVQARPVTVTAPQTAPTEWNPAAMAAKYVFGT